MVSLDRARRRRRLPGPEVRKLLRERAGLTQAAVARALGVTAACVCRWESGDRGPREANLPGYLNLLDQLAREGLVSPGPTTPPALSPTFIKSRGA